MYAFPLSYVLLAYKGGKGYIYTRDCGMSIYIFSLFIINLRKIWDICSGILLRVIFGIPVSLMVWRQRIGCYNCLKFSKTISIMISEYISLTVMLSVGFITVFVFLDVFSCAVYTITEFLTECSSFFFINLIVYVLSYKEKLFREFRFKYHKILKSLLILV